MSKLPKMSATISCIAESNLLHNRPITNLGGKWADDTVAEERQRIKRGRLLQELVETGLLTQMEKIDRSAQNS